MLEEIRASNLWHPVYQLPLSPQNNNPWFYLALTVKVIFSRGESLPEDFMFQVQKYMEACEKSPGLFDRWPKQAADDVTSHDELIGIAYLNQNAARRILDYLEANDWEYNNSPVVTSRPMEHDLSKFIWFSSWLKSRAGVPLSTLGQLKYAIHILYDMVTVRSGDASGRLLIWVTSVEMEKYPACRAVLIPWRALMAARGITPKTVLALEPKENPILSELAMDKF